MYRKMAEKLMGRSPEVRMVLLDCAAHWIKDKAETESLTNEDAVAMRAYLSRLVEFMVEPSESVNHDRAMELMDLLGEVVRTAVDFIDEAPEV